LESFSKNRAKPDGLSSHCKDCHKVMRREHYIKNKPKIIAQVYKKQEEYCEWLNSLKIGPCVDCGKSYPHYCMDFDHLRDKEFSISMARKGYWAREKILKEIEKCELVCAICHRIRTHQRLNAPLT
jgi:hypothetical protein